MSRNTIAMLCIVVVFAYCAGWSMQARSPAVYVLPIFVLFIVTMSLPGIAAIILSGIATRKLNAEDYAGAEKLYWQALRLYQLFGRQPERAPYHTCLAVAQRHQNKFDESKKHLELAVELTRGKSDAQCTRNRILALNHMAALHLDRLQFEPAARLFESCVEESQAMEPASNDLWLHTENLAWVLQNQGKIEQALKLHASAFSLAQEQKLPEASLAWLHLNYIDCLLKADQNDRAMQMFELVDHYIKNAPPGELTNAFESEVLAVRGLLQLHRGNLQQAENDFETALAKSDKLQGVYGQCRLRVLTRFVVFLKNQQRDAAAAGIEARALALENDIKLGNNYSPMRIG